METILTSAFILQLIGPIVSYKNGREQRRFEAAKIVCMEQHYCEPLKSYLPKGYRNVEFTVKGGQKITPITEIEDDQK